jgi:hypothetical protein
MYQPIVHFCGAANSIWLEGVVSSITNNKDTTTAATKMATSAPAVKDDIWWILVMFDFPSVVATPSQEYISTYHMR